MKGSDDGIILEHLKVGSLLLGHAFSANFLPGLNIGNCVERITFVQIVNIFTFVLLLANWFVENLLKAYVCIVHI